MLLTSAIWSNVGAALSSMSLWNSIVKCVLIIVLGFALRKIRILPENTPKILTKVVLKVALPCLAFKAFMTDISSSQFNSAIFAFVYGFFIYVLMIFAGRGLFKLIYPNMDVRKRRIFEVLFAFGSTTFFGQPIIEAVFPNAFLDSNMFNIAYRVFLYSFAYITVAGTVLPKAGESISDASKPGAMKMSGGEALKKMFLNPIVIATFLGFILWSLQLAIGGNANVTVAGKTAVFYRIDVSLPPLYQTMSTLGSLCSPLVWIAIGCTLAAIPIKEAASDREAWIYCGLKNLLLPAANLILLSLINLIPGLSVTVSVVACTTIMLAAPPATVAVTYCISMDREAVKASNFSLLSTLVAVVCIPLWIIVITAVTSGSFFAA